MSGEPITMHAPSGAAWFFTLWAAAIAVTAVPWALSRLARHRDSLPILLLTGGFLSGLLEPMLDHLGHLWYPRDLPLGLFTNFGITIPLLVPFAYASFGGITGYAGYRFLRSRPSRRRIMVAWLALACADLVLEYPGVTLGVYRYWGDQPFNVFGYPWWWFPPAGTAMLLIAFFAWALEDRLRGVERVLIVAAVPMAISISYFVTCWPAFLALNSGAPAVVQWLATGLTLPLGALVATVVAQIAGAPSSNADVPAADEPRDHAGAARSLLT